MAWLRQFIKAAHRADSEHESEDEGEAGNLDTQLHDAEGVQPMGPNAMSMEKQIPPKTDVSAPSNGKGQMPSRNDQSSSAKQNTSNGQPTMSGRAKQLVGVREINFAG